MIKSSIEAIDDEVSKAFKALKAAEEKGLHMAPQEFEDHVSATIRLIAVRLRICKAWVKDPTELERDSADLETRYVVNSALAGALALDSLRPVLAEAGLTWIDSISVQSCSNDATVADAERAAALQMIFICYEAFSSMIQSHVEEGMKDKALV